MSEDGGEDGGRLVVPLDVAVPEPILAALDEHMVDIALTPLHRIDRRLTEVDDRTLVLALRQDGFDWLATDNDKILRNPSELAAILRAGVNIFAVQGTGGDPLRALGALLLDLPEAVRRANGLGEVFWSRPRRPAPRRPWDLFEEAAARHGQTADDLYDQVKVTDDEMATPWWTATGPRPG